MTNEVATGSKSGVQLEMNEWGVAVCFASRKFRPFSAKTFDEPIFFFKWCPPGGGINLTTEHFGV